ncbi:MAG: stage III sporulation protein AE [Clostridiales bacterium]|nr:stage III sporulation protein AE [Clostridiales bacterium]
MAFLPLAAFAEPENADDDAAVAEEIARQTEKLDLSGWEEYFESVGRLTKSDAHTIAEFIESRAVNGEAEDPGGLFGAILVLFRAELKKSVGAAAALTAAALLTALSGIVGDEGIRPLLGTLLCTAALTLSAAVLASLSKTTWDAVGAAGRFAEKVTPVMSALLVSLGAPSAAGIFRPLMVFLTGTVTVLVERAVLPIALACGAVGIADALTDGKQLGELIKTGQKTVKWLLGLVSTFYFGVTAVQGLTVSARDGIAVRTAKYAIDRLAPLTGGIIGGTADSVMACALLLKNGVGAVAVLILLSIMLRPLIVLLTGIFVFRVSAALSAPVADPRVPRLFSNAADVTGGLFACAAVTGAMLLLTILVFVTSAGICAGLW